MNLRDFMLGHGWKLVNEDHDHSLFTCMMRPHTNRTVLVNLLSLAGYDCHEPPGYTVPPYLYIRHPLKP